MFYKELMYQLFQIFKQFFKQMEILFFPEIKLFTCLQRVQVLLDMEQRELRHLEEDEWDE